MSCAEGRRHRAQWKYGRSSHHPPEENWPAGQIRTDGTNQASGRDYLSTSSKNPGEFLFGGRCGLPRSITTRQYARLVSEWVVSIGLDPHKFGTHSLRRTKATLIYRRTGNLRAVQLLLGHTKIESTARYLGIEVDDALTIAEQVDI
jgi:integrase